MSLPSLAALPLGAAATDRDVRKKQRDSAIKKKHSDAKRREKALKRIVGLVDQMADNPPRKNWLRNKFTGPIRVGDAELEQLLNISELADLLCAGAIEEDYVRYQLETNAENLVWTISSSGAPGFAPLYGFAVCEPQGKGLDLAIICSMRGGGLVLFEEILRYAHDRRDVYDFFTLDAIDKGVLGGYEIVAKSVFAPSDGTDLPYLLGGDEDLQKRIPLFDVEQLPRATLQEEYDARVKRASRVA